MALPHITNSKAGVNKWDPVHSNIFEVSFSIPEALQAEFGQDTALLTEHVLKISGLDSLAKAPTTAQQKFMGTDRSYIVPKLDNTYAEISIDLTLNLRDKTDNFIYKLFRAWGSLGYNIRTGERRLKQDYVADYLEIKIANREGDVYWDVIFKDVMMNGGIEGLADFEYETGDAQQITVKFISDWWQETMV